MRLFEGGGEDTAQTLKTGMVVWCKERLVQVSADSSIVQILISSDNKKPRYQGVKAEGTEKQSSQLLFLPL